MYLGLGNFFDDKNAPNLTDFSNNGVFAENAKAVTPTDSAQNWGSLLHGVNRNKLRLDNGDFETEIEFNNEKYPSIFKIISNYYKDHIKMAVFASWKTIITSLIERSINLNCYSPMINENFFVRKYLNIMHNLFQKPLYDEYTIKELMNFLTKLNQQDKEQLKLVFVHLTDLDEVGHCFGFKTKEYFNQILITDKYLKLITDKIEDVLFDYKKLIIITTDHGGIGKSHGGSSEDECNVFVSIGGNGITKDLIEKEMKNMDCAAIILKALDIELPEHFDAKFPTELERQFNFN